MLNECRPGQYIYSTKLIDLTQKNHHNLWTPMSHLYKKKKKKFLQHIYKTALSLCIIQNISKAVQYIFIYFFCKEILNTVVSLKSPNSLIHNFMREILDLCFERWVSLCQQSFRFFEHLIFQWDVCNSIFFLKHLTHFTPQLQQHMLHLIIHSQSLTKYFCFEIKIIFMQHV